MGKTRKKIVLLTTGGTIASEPNEENDLLVAGSMPGEKLLKQCDLPSYIDIEIISVLQIPSNQMNFTHLMTLKREIDNVLKRDDVAGVVITHGTDTLEETAYFLDLVINDERPIVVTGSQRGPTLLGTDAYVNLRQSILLASHKEAYDLGVIVLFNERIFSARYVKKVHTSNLDGFKAHKFGYLGTVDQEDVYIYQKPVHKETYDIKIEIPEIEIVKVSLGSDGRLIQLAAESGIKGLVIEALGRGHVPPRYVQHIEKAIQQGVHVVLTTSGDEGTVKSIYDFPGSVDELETLGVILGADFDSKKARIKLAVLLASETEITHF